MRHLAVLLCVLVSICTAIRAEDIVYPDDAGVVSVKSYGAIGDGVHDDTSAIQAAINGYVGSRHLIYFPDGTYLISAATLTLPNENKYGWWMWGQT